MRLTSWGVVIPVLLAVGCGKNDTSPSPARPSPDFALPPTSSSVVQSFADAVAVGSQQARSPESLFGMCLRDSNSEPACAVGAGLLTFSSVRAPLTAAPGNLVATASGTSVTLVWSAPFGGDLATYYLVEAGSAPGLSNLASISTGSTSTTFSATGVYPGRYYVRVRAGSATGISSPSNEVTLIVNSGNCAGAPGIPSQLTIASNSSRDVVFTWAAASGPVSSYVVEAGSAPGLADIANSDLGSADTTLRAAGLASGLYYVRIRARNACGLSAPSNEVTLAVGPSNCVLSLGSTTATFDGSANVGSFSVMTSGSCVWSAASSASWLTITANGSGTGTAILGYAVTANTGSSTRTATITVTAPDATTQTFTVTQFTGPTTCGLTLGSSTAAFDYGANVGSFSVMPTAGCGAWTAVSSASWLTITANASGTGTAIVGYAVAANTGNGSRTATITISAAGASSQTLTVTQSPPSSCTLILGSTTATFTNTASVGSFSVMPTAACGAWTAVSSASWLTITANGSGIGTAIVGYAVAANTGNGSRTATITISAGASSQTFAVTQSPPLTCTLTLGSTTANVPNTASVGSFSVMPTAACGAWTAVSSASWLTITANGSGTGTAIVGYAATANVGSGSRAATITVSAPGATPQTFTVTQSAPTACVLTLGSSGATVSGDAGVGSFSVVTAGACLWTAVSSASWLTITANASGTSTAIVGYAVAANTGINVRTAGITVSAPGATTQTFTVSQGITPVTLRVTTNGTGGGRVTSTPSGINGGINVGGGSSQSASFTRGTFVLLSAVADSGSTFAGWGGACSGQGLLGCGFTITADSTVTATFTRTTTTCTTSTVSVSATQFWQDSHIALTVGSSVSIAASGTWGDSAGSVDADGRASQTVQGPTGTVPLPNQAIMKLAGKIGSGGTAFAVGRSTGFSAALSGNLFFAPNDRSDILWDNYGSLSVSVTRCGP